MNDIAVQPTNTTARAARPSIVQSFGIEGLYGYRDISLTSNYAATILIARNGTGKTTLLGALDALLRLQLTRLRELEFTTIRCRLIGIEDELVLTHDDLVEFLQVPADSDLPRIASRCNITIDTLFQYLMNEYSGSTPQERRLADDKVSTALRSGFGYSFREQEVVLEKVWESLFERQPGIKHIRSSLKVALRDTEIVYLPTYRRVELALLDDPNRNAYGRRQSPKFSVAAGSLYTGDIQFGLGDISDRLSAMHSQIVNSSNNGYRQISANIIKDLIDGSFANQEIPKDSLPTREELSLFFSRIKENKRSNPFPSVDDPDLDRLYSLDQVPEESQKFLPYFLAQLGKVIDTAKAVEAPVDAFIESCNRYLRSEEPSTSIEGKDGKDFDTKELCLNRRSLSVHVESTLHRRRISLNSLSSGEKQMISLFAKLFLYPKFKIVLIDEPELSLSIDWQSQILVDVLNSPLCNQVIAITHSPFVFDNELDPFARSLDVTNFVGDPHLFVEDESLSSEFYDAD